MHVVLNFLEQLVCMLFSIFWNSLCACCFKFSGTACVHVVLHHSPFTLVRSEVVKRLNIL